MSEAKANKLLYRKKAFLLLGKRLYLAHACAMKKSTNNTAKEVHTVEPEYVGVDKAEVMSGLSRWTWRHYAYQGKIASVKAGKRLLIPVSEIRRIMGEGYRPAVV